LNTSTQEWKDKHIKSWIPISPVYNGSAKILKALISGDNAGIPIISNIETKKVMHTWDSLYWLAPKFLGPFIKAKNRFFGWGEGVD